MFRQINKRKSVLQVDTDYSLELPVFQMPVLAAMKFYVLPRHVNKVKFIVHQRIHKY